MLLLLIPSLWRCELTCICSPNCRDSVSIVLIDFFLPVQGKIYPLPFFYSWGFCTEIRCMNPICSISIKQWRQIDWSLYCLCLFQQQGEQTYFEFLAQSFHSGQVTGLDVCLRKPLVATCSNDRSVRIWNYESWWVMQRNRFQTYKSIGLYRWGYLDLSGFQK